MKKLLSVILCFLFGAVAFSLAACTDGAGETPDDGEPPLIGGATNGATDGATDGGNDNTAGGDTTILVAYFSATNRTRTVAGYIAEATGADTFEFVPVNAYSSADLNYNDRNSRVYREYEDESLRDIDLVSVAVENWAEYDTVFIGYPIWWGIAAWPVNGFLKQSDFTGKTVIPFATSASSGLGQSAALLAQTAGSGDWQTGQRFQSSASRATVNEWVATLGLSD